MRINNVSSVTSMQRIVWLSIILLFFAIALIVLFCFFTPMQLFQAFLSIEDTFEKFYIGFMVLIFPLLSVWALISEIKSRNKALECLSHGLNLKYVDFLQGRIHFKFTESKYNFVCGYNDIEQIKMKLNTTIVHTKNGSYVALNEIQIDFHVLNGKTFSINNTPLRPAKFLYKFIDYTRGIQNFSYRFTGAGEVEDLKERIDDYRKRGCKQILSTPQENGIKLTSILVFAIGLFFIFSFLYEITRAIEKGDFGILIMLSPFIIMFMVIPLILDGFLIADKINDRKFHIEHKSKDFIGKIPCEFIVAVQVIIVAVLVFTVCRPLIFSGTDKKILNTNNEFKELWVNPPSEFNNMRKDEIYSHRKAYVKDSLFVSDNYEPNERVFGAIEDYKPWWGEQKCRPLNYTGDYHESIEGESKQSIQINNPNALVGLSSPYIPWDVEANSDFCNSEYARFIPKSLKYSEKDNLIVAEYEVSKDFPDIYVNIANKGYRYPIQLSGLNALDFGYKYVYAFNTKNIEMSYPNNITENVEIFRDYIHVGSSCGYEGGCNNISPMQNDKMISVQALPAEINLKLWKKQPRDKYSRADMYYRIIFTEQ